VANLRLPGRGPKSGRSMTDLSAEESRRTASTGIVPAHLFEVDADRPKRIDQYIDYFGRIGAGRNVALWPRAADR
jgi:hypothetical protein